MAEFKENLPPNMNFNRFSYSSQGSNFMKKSEPLKSSSGMNSSLGLFRNLSIGKSWNSLDIPKPSKSGFSKSFNGMNQGNSTFGSISSLNSLKSSSRSSQSESRWKNLNDDLLHRDTQKCLKMHLNPKEPKKASKGVLMKKKLHERFQKLKKIGNFDLSFLDKEKQSILRQNNCALLNAYNNFMNERETMMKVLEIPFCFSKTFNSGCVTDDNVAFLLMLLDAMSKELRLNEVDAFVIQEMDRELFGTAKNVKLMEAIETVRKAYFVSSPVTTEELNFQKACDKLIRLIKEATYVMWLVNILKSD